MRGWKRGGVVLEGNGNGGGGGGGVLAWSSASASAAHPVCSIVIVVGCQPCLRHCGLPTSARLRRHRRGLLAPSSSVGCWCHHRRRRHDSRAWWWWCVIHIMICWRGLVNSIEKKEKKRKTYGGPNNEGRETRDEG
jgi:hypothetical protein